MAHRHSLTVGWCALLACGAACGPSPQDEVPFPEDYETQWQEAREPCRLSHDHELRYIRVFADADAVDPYTTFESPYPEGATLLKAEYYDDACTDLLGWVVMEKLAEGQRPETEDWRWLRFTPDREPVDDPERIPSTCVGCHRYHCSRPPYGWDFSCAPDLEPGT